jgi:hypothetical protein
VRLKRVVLGEIVSKQHVEKIHQRRTPTFLSATPYKTLHGQAVNIVLFLKRPHLVICTGDADILWLHLSVNSEIVCFWRLKMVEKICAKFRIILFVVELG